MLKNYFKIALKVLLRRKFFTFISLFAISFTLVVLMVASALIDHVFAPMPPETRLERTLGLFYMEMKGPQSTWSGNPGYRLLDSYSRGLQGVEMFSIVTEQKPVTSYLEGVEVKSMLKRTDGEYWQILDFTFLEGRPLSDEDERNANYAAVINRATRERFFGGEPALGKTIEADKQRFQVVGVVENVPTLRPVAFADIWVPNSTTPQVADREKIMGSCIGLMVARSRDDFPLIKKEFQSRLAGVDLREKEYLRLEGSPETFAESEAREMFGEANAMLLFCSIVLGMVLFMLLPTINLININMSRIIERSSEIGVRKSFGASSLTLVGQFVTENLILTFIGGIAGFVVAALILDAINASGLIQYARLQLNMRIFFYGFCLIGFFGLLSGVYPAWKMSRLHPVLALKGAVR